MSERRRLYVPELPAAPALLTLPPQAHAHAHVLRLRVGSWVELFDAKGGSADARVLELDRKRLVCEVQGPRFAAARTRRLCLIVCVPKATKLELIVRMVTELGVSVLALADSERAVSKLSAESPKLERLRRIAIEACAQSEQAWAPELRAPVPLTAAASAAPAWADKRVFWTHARQPLALTPSDPAAAHEVWAIVGPEGGLCEQEVHALSQLGYVPVGLGRAVLRVETACAVVSALILDRLGVLC